jgi:hypothetical protein
MVTEADIGKLVRIRSVDGQQHWMRGRLIAMASRGRVAIVKPFTHKHAERIPAKWVNVWKAKHDGTENKE